MPSFPKPKFPYTLQTEAERTKLQQARMGHAKIKIPVAAPGQLLMATWNIANLGEQKREEGHLKLIAEIISWFDVVALQEIKENYQDFAQIMQLLGSDFGYIMSDDGGNNERLAFVFRRSRVKPLEEIAELALAPAELSKVQFPGVTSTFEGFDRNPYIASFDASGFLFTLGTGHLYYGDDSTKEKIDRRLLEAFALGRWAANRAASKNTFRAIKNVFAMGDFNVPKAAPGDPIFDALVKKGLVVPEHTSQVFSNIVNDKQYDQIAFLPGSKKRVLNSGIFSFDLVLCSDLYQNQGKKDFQAYMRYYFSDHRPFWMLLQTNP